MNSRASSIVVALALTLAVCAALVVRTTLARAAAAPPCSSAGIVARIAGTDGAAGTIGTTIDLINVSHGACTIPAFPHVALALSGSSAVSKSLKIEHAGTGSPLELAPNAAGRLTILWSDVDGAGPCRPVADAYVSLSSGLPFWIPLEADACRPLREMAVVRNPVVAAPPSARAIEDAWNVWSVRMTCPGYLGMYLKGSDAFRAPAHEDGFAFPAPRAIGLALLFDPQRGIVGTVQTMTGGATIDDICGGQTSVPYDVAYAALGTIATHRGVRLGMTPQQVERLDGAAHVYSISGAYSTLGYLWSGGRDAFVVLFLHGRAVGMGSFGQRNRS